jgi:peptidoglycan/xylan/chitin deacetylase (PgdA/CDA1 family)
MLNNENKIIILVFHGVTDVTSVSTDAWIPSLKRITPAKLASCLDILIRNDCQFISIPEAVDIINKRFPIKKNYVCLTFDDGFRNQLTRVVPIIEKYKAPATFFIVTDPVENQVPYWFDRADYAIQHLPVKCLELVIGTEKFMIRAENRDAMADSLTLLRKMYRRYTLEEIEEAVVKIEKAAGVSLAENGMTDERSAILTWEELRQLASNKYITLGSHTVSHSRLNSLDDDAAFDELRNSRLALQSKAGVACDCLALPSGLFNDATFELIKKAGYKAAVTSIFGVNSYETDIYKLKRINVPAGQSAEELLKRVIETKIET